MHSFSPEARRKAILLWLSKHHEGRAYDLSRGADISSIYLYPLLKQLINEGVLTMVWSETQPNGAIYVLTTRGEELLSTHHQTVKQPAV